MLLSVCLLGSDLNVHVKSEKLRLSGFGTSIRLLKVNIPCFFGKRGPKQVFLASWISDVVL